MAKNRPQQSNRLTRNSVEKSRRRRIRFFLIVIIAIIILTFINLKTVIRTADEAKNKSSEMDINEGIEEKAILKSEDRNDWINNIKIYSKKSDNAKYILENLDQLDDPMIRLASDRPDALGFVAKFINPSRRNNFDYDRNGYNTIVTPNKSIPYYVQWDEAWGYKQYGYGIIGFTGCGPTSMAMVVSGLTGDKNITPDVIANMSEEKGFVSEEGSSWDLYPYIAGQFNLRLQKIGNTKESIDNNLKAGNAIIVSVGPGDFTLHGHVMVMVGLDKDGNIILHDPNSVENTKKTWTYEQLAPQIKSLWAVGTNK